MRSNRTIQTILQAILLVLVAAIAFQLPSLGNPQRGAPVGRSLAPQPPSPQDVVKAYREYLNDWKKGDLREKADVQIDVRDIAVEGSIAHVKLLLTVKWRGPRDLEYSDGPLKGAPGVRGDTYRYAQVFLLRYWSRGWDFEDHVEPPELLQ